jgi:hypothetical protein
MRDRFLCSMIMVGVSAGVSVVISSSITRTSAQAPAASVSAPTAALKTPWGEPDLQGIWTEETDTPLQRPPKYADQEFFTPEQRQVAAGRAGLAGRRVMLSQDLARYVDLHRSLGFGFRIQHSVLRNLVAFAEAQGDRSCASPA